ncbi:MAG: hypothetical protein ABFD79_15375 [Phycisphaerales bacterium]
MATEFTSCLIPASGQTIFSSSRLQQYFCNGIIPAFCVVTFEGIQFHNNICTQYGYRDTATKNNWKASFIRDFNGTYIVPYRSTAISFPLDPAWCWVSYELKIPQALTISEGTNGSCSSSSETCDIYIWVNMWYGGRVEAGIITDRNLRFDSQALFTGSTERTYAYFTQTAVQRRATTGNGSNFTFWVHNSRGATCQVSSYANVDNIQECPWQPDDNAPDRKGRLAMQAITGEFAPEDVLYVTINGQEKELCTLDAVSFIDGGVRIPDTCVDANIVNKRYFINATEYEDVWVYPPAPGRYDYKILDKNLLACNGTVTVRGALPACFDKATGQMKVVYENQDYYACFNQSTGKWKVTLPV